MSDIVTVALISFASAVIVALIGLVGNIVISKKDRKKRNEAEAVSQALLDEHLKEIDRKLDEHNGYARKFGNIEKSIAVIETEIKNLKGK